MNSIADSWHAVRQRLTAAEECFEREPGSVGLLAVSKGQPAGAIREVAALGQQSFGESRVQEALPKLEVLAALGLEWHFIGPVQSNKTRAIAEHFSWVHSVEREKIAVRLSEQRITSGLAPLNICVELNVSGEESKSGVAPEGLEMLVERIKELPGLTLRGLMAIPQASTDPEYQRAQFGLLRAALERLNAQGMQLDTLSMGMSGDLEAAVAEGATMVRVGRAIFGARVVAGQDI